MYTPAVTIERADRSRADHRVGQPDIERNLCGLAGRADKEQDADRGRGAAKQVGIVAKLDEVQRPDAVRTRHQCG
jgi:hypothetical protein